MFAYESRAHSPGREREAVPEATLGAFPTEGEAAFALGRAFPLREAADRLGISLRQIEMHVADGTLPAVNVGRGRLRRDLRILDEDLDRFVTARKVAPIRHAQAPQRSGGRRRATRTAEIGSFAEAYLNRSTKGRQ